MATRIGRRKRERERGLLTCVDAWLQKIKIQWRRRIGESLSEAKTSHTRKNIKQKLTEMLSHTQTPRGHSVLQCLQCWSYWKSVYVFKKKYKKVLFNFYFLQCFEHHNSFVCWWRDFYHCYISVFLENVILQKTGYFYCNLVPFWTFYFSFMFSWMLFVWWSYPRMDIKLEKYL